jgi:hypothetical protein
MTIKVRIPRREKKKSRKEMKTISFAKLALYRGWWGDFLFFVTGNYRYHYFHAKRERGEL